MSTKWPLGPLLCELSEQLRSRCLELHLDWQARDLNVDADSITNEDYSSFELSRRVEVDFPSIPWLVLDQAMQWSKEVYDITEQAKFKRKETPFTAQTVRKKKRTAAAKRLKATDPW